MLFGINGLKGQYQFAYNLVYTIARVIGIIIVLRIYQQDTNVSYKMSWIIFILLAPFFGTVCYLLFGNGRQIPKRKSRKIENYLSNKIPKNDEMYKLLESDPKGYKLAKAVHENTGFPIYTNTKTIFFPDASLKHEDLLRDLYEAKKFIFLEYFIVADGRVLEDVITALEVKGSEGVEIKFLYDDVGSKAVLKKSTIQRIASIPNTKIFAYEPLGFNINPAVNYRDHRKIAIIDGQIAYCGGDNLADEYTHLKNKYGFWRDNALRLEGEAVYSYTVLFASMWYMSSKETLDVTNYYAKTDIEAKSIVMPFGDGPTNNFNPAYELFINMINNADKSIYISTPYFIIDKCFTDAICRAARNGVDVKILVPHIPDKKAIFMMTRSHFGPILKAGGKIYEFLPGFNHAKNVIIDEKYAFVGTVNMDYRSLFLHFECGTLIMHDKSIDLIQKDFLEAVEDSKETNYQEWKERSPIMRLIELVLNVISPLL